MTEKDLEAVPTTSATPADTDEGTDSSLLELTRGLEKAEGEKEEGEKAVKEDTVVPPNTPQSGISVLAHKIWIGNLDKRLSQ